LAPNKSFSVETATKEEAKEWMFHLNMCINSLPSISFFFKKKKKNKK